MDKKKKPFLSWDSSMDDVVITNSKKKEQEGVSQPKKMKPSLEASAPQKNPVMFVDKYKPATSKQVVGQQPNAEKLAQWLRNWHKNRESEMSSQGSGGSKGARSQNGSSQHFKGGQDGLSQKAVLLSGPPGIGKTTTAQLVCAETGFLFKELNASDTRSKKSLTEEVTVLLANRVLDGYFMVKNRTIAGGMRAQHALIMDEVDGMAGNEDRGGVAELIQLIKKTKVPIICICNDRMHPKIRSLQNYCYDLRFYKPQATQIKACLMSVAAKEGISIDSSTVDEIVASCNHDIRQALHYLNMISAKKINKSFAGSKSSMKDVKLGPFEAIKKVFPSAADFKNMKLSDRCDLFFYDYNLMPLMVFENYLKASPHVRKSEVDRMASVARAADALSFGDLIEKSIRSQNNWSLLPLQSCFSVAIPSYQISGCLMAMPMFPSFMGKLSNYNKRQRLLQELKIHMNLKISGSKTALALDYLEPLRDAILRKMTKEDIEATVEFLNSYYLRKEDLDSIMELSIYGSQDDPFGKIDSKKKAALTRALNQSSELLPYATQNPAAKKNRIKLAASSDMIDGAEDGDEDVIDNSALDDGEEDQKSEDEDDPETDGMIQKVVKKPGKKEAASAASKKPSQNKKKTTESASSKPARKKKS